MRTRERQTLTILLALKSYSWSAYEALEVGNNDTANFFACFGRTNFKAKKLAEFAARKMWKPQRIQQKSEKIIFSSASYTPESRIHFWT